MSKKKVMLVLDDETGILGIFEELMGAEFEIHCCKNVTEAKNILKEHKPDIMFLDYLVDGEVAVATDHVRGELDRTDKGLPLLRILHSRLLRSWLRALLLLLAWGAESQVLPLDPRHLLP